MAGADYIRVTHADPHVGRGRQILAAHPEVRALASEFYSSLRAHYSWTALLVTFLRDREVTLFSRIVR